MNTADRIQNLRKAKGISQEKLADEIGVSRQAVSKWESEQSVPDIEKIILLSDYFGVTTDYLLKGIEPDENTGKKPDGRIFTAVATAINILGLIAAIMLWIERQISGSVAVGAILMVLGCMIFVIGQFMGDHGKVSQKWFLLVNVWVLTLMPISCVFNMMEGFLPRFGWQLSPIPQLGNSFWSYGMCWMVYLIICVLTDVLVILQFRNKE